jgi:uncharacterized metal-binding protein YceD (DUF177 family)
MKIYVSTIPFSGMKIDGYLPLQPLNDRLAEGKDIPELSFTEPPALQLVLTRAYGGITVRGMVTGQCAQTCATCADPKVHTVTADIDLILQSATEAAAGGDDLLDDPGVLTYAGDHVDLEDPLQEALILGLSPFWHPPRSEREECTACGRDCSTKAWTKGEEASSAAPKGPSLGKLLEGALSKAKKGS